MCGRFTQHYTWSELYDALNLTSPDAPRNLEPRYNLGRFQTVDMVRPIERGNELVRALWEFVPFYWKKPLKEKKWSSFNAKSETLTQSRAFSPAWKRGQRCIVPISGFYEWPRPAKKGQPPYYIHSSTGPILFLAGLWSDWEDTEKEEWRTSCTVITTEPNALMREIPHHRCPAVISGRDLEQWIRGTEDDAYALLAPPPDDAMVAYTVSPYVNKIGNEGRECIEPIVA